MAAEPPGKPRDIGMMLPYLLAGPGLGLLGILGYAWALDSGLVLAVAVLVAGAAFVVGALLGFLFGIPRSLAGDASAGSQEAPSEGGSGNDSPRRATYQSNTNLEQISDWLTKILVGVGLVELGKISRGIGNLTDALSPALGDAPSSSGFGLSVVLLYTVSGFLIVYLATRVYLPSVFTQADLIDLKNYTDERVDSLRKQTQNDAEALALAMDQLNPEGHPVIDEARLADAVRAASPAVRRQIFSLARDQRIRANKENHAEQVTATIPVFRSLIQSDTNDVYHRNHAQLAYALRRALERDPAGAIDELDKAIVIRDRTGTTRAYRKYEYRRAVARIEADPKGVGGQASDPEVREQIVADLRVAMTSKTVAVQVAGSVPVNDWLARNGLTQADLSPGQGA